MNRKGRIVKTMLAMGLAVSLLAGCEGKETAEPATTAAVTSEETTTQVAETTEAIVTTEEQPGIAYKWTEVPALEGCEVLGIPYKWRQNENFESDTPVTDGLYFVEKNGSYGIIDQQGTWIAEPTYFSVEYAYGYCLSEGVNYSGVYTVLDDRSLAAVDEIPELIGTAPGFYLVYDVDSGKMVYGGGGGAEAIDTDYQMKGVVGTTACTLEDMGGMLYPQTAYDGKYAVISEGTPVTEFEYDRINCYSSGLFAALKGDKWGYLNADGQVVIPFEYDAVRSLDTDFSYAAAATEGYVVLCKDGAYELVTTDNESVIPAGEFEKLTEVVDGKLYAKKDGVWGIVQLLMTE